MQYVLYRYAGPSVCSMCYIGMLVPVCAVCVSDLLHVVYRLVGQVVMRSSPVRQTWVRSHCPHGAVSSWTNDLKIELQWPPCQPPDITGSSLGLVGLVSWTNDLKIELQWPPCQPPDITGSSLGLVGLVSVYYDWVRWQV